MIHLESLWGNWDLIWKVSSVADEGIQKERKALSKVYVCNVAAAAEVTGFKYGCARMFHEPRLNKLNRHKQSLNFKNY